MTRRLIVVSRFRRLAYHHWMVQLNAHFDGKVIVPDEPLMLPPNQRLRIHIEPLDQPVSQVSQPESKRRLGLQSGTVQFIADDFGEELGDGFWVGNGQ